MPVQIMDDFERSSSKMDGILFCLLLQPPEVIGEVLQWLDLKDLLSLRISNRKLHALVHFHEKSICARFCSRLRRQNSALQLPAKIHGLTNDLLFYIELQRRYSAIQDLASLLSNHVVSRIQIQQATCEKHDMEQWRMKKIMKLRQHLFPGLFLLNNFLECLYAVYISGEEAFADWENDMLMSLHDVYDLDQQRIIEDFSPCDEKTIINVTAALAVLCGVAKSKQLSLSSKSSKYPFASLKRILLSAGLIPFPVILDPLTAPQDPRINLVQASDNLWQGKRRRPVKYDTPRLGSIHHLDTERVHFLTELAPSRCHRARNWFVERQDIWNKAAFAVLQRLGSTTTFPPDTDEWLKTNLSEQGDLAYQMGNWKIPEPT